MIDHDAMQQVAVLLADPLRRAWCQHLDSDCSVCAADGIAWCPEAMRLFDLLPSGDRTAFLGTVS